MSRTTLVAACAAALMTTSSPALAAHLEPAPRSEVKPKQKKRKPAPRVAVPGVLVSIAACESGGNPRAVSADGTYRGKYQFDRQTWAAMGGSGDPAAAPEAEQDARAVALLDQAGTSPWPVCGA